MHFSQQVGLPYYALALSGEYVYHVAVFSKYPFQEVHTLTPLMRACAVVLVNTESGLISIASLHLTPYSEDLRHPEIDLIVQFQKHFPNRILMGDMNSLSRHDNYAPEMVKSFNEKQLQKFTTNGQLRFDAIDKIMSVGYFDSAWQLGKNKEYTAPTAINEYNAHSQMILDYIFFSQSLLQHLKEYKVIKNEITEKASDHYPITVVLD